MYVLFQLATGKIKPETMSYKERILAIMHTFDVMFFLLAFVLFVLQYIKQSVPIFEMGLVAAMIANYGETFCALIRRNKDRFVTYASLGAMHCMFLIAAVFFL